MTTENGNTKKYSSYSPENQLMSYGEYEYVKIGETKSVNKTESDKEYFGGQMK